MIFNSFITANDYSFGTQMTLRPSRFHADKYNIERHLFRFYGDIPSKGIENSSVFETILLF